MRICLDDGKWITETAPAAVIYLTAAPWPVPNGAASCWGLDPHLWAQLFPALLGTARSVQLSAQQEQLMRCKYVKLFPLSQGSCKQWSHTGKTWFYDGRAILCRWQADLAWPLQDPLTAGWWSHLLHGTLGTLHAAMQGRITFCHRQQ